MYMTNCSVDKMPRLRHHRRLRLMGIQVIAGPIRTDTAFLHTFRPEKNSTSNATKHVRNCRRCSTSAFETWPWMSFGNWNDDFHSSEAGDP